MSLSAASGEKLAIDGQIPIEFDWISDNNAKGVWESISRLPMSPTLDLLSKIYWQKGVKFVAGEAKSYMISKDETMAQYNNLPFFSIDLEGHAALNVDQYKKKTDYWDAQGGILARFHQDPRKTDFNPAAKTALNGPAWLSLQDSKDNVSNESSRMTGAV